MCTSRNLCCHSLVSAGSKIELEAFQRIIYILESYLGEERHLARMQSKHLSGGLASTAAPPHSSWPNQCPGNGRVHCSYAPHSSKQDEYGKSSRTQDAAWHEEKQDTGWL